MTLHLVTPLDELAERLRALGVTVEIGDLPDWQCQVCNKIDCEADCTVTWLPPSTRQRRTRGMNRQAHGLNLMTALQAFVLPVARGRVVVRLKGGGHG